MLGPRLLWLGLFTLTVHFGVAQFGLAFILSCWEACSLQDPILPDFEDTTKIEAVVSQLSVSCEYTAMIDVLYELSVSCEDTTVFEFCPEDECCGE